jgi:uncharacterized Zn finger protein
MTSCLGRCRHESHDREPGEGSGRTTVPRFAPAGRSRAVRPTAEVAVKQRQTYLRYLEALLAAELEERERNTIARRIKDAHLPRLKTLEEFDFTKAPQVKATEIHELAQGGYIERAEPVIKSATPAPARRIC